jgi:hypothetical protein
VWAETRYEAVGNSTATTTTTPHRQGVWDVHVRDGKVELEGTSGKVVREGSPQKDKVVEPSADLRGVAGIGGQVGVPLDPHTDPHSAYGAAAVGNSTATTTTTPHRQGVWDVLLRICGAWLA